MKAGLFVGLWEEEAVAIAAAAVHRLVDHR